MRGRQRLADLAPGAEARVEQVGRGQAVESGLVEREPFGLAHDRTVAHDAQVREVGQVAAHVRGTGGGAVEVVDPHQEG